MYLNITNLILKDNQIRIKIVERFIASIGYNRCRLVLAISHALE